MRSSRYLARWQSVLACQSPARMLRRSLARFIRSKPNRPASLIRHTIVVTIIVAIIAVAFMAVVIMADIIAGVITDTAIVTVVITVTAIITAVGGTKTSAIDHKTKRQGFNLGAL